MLFRGEYSFLSNMYPCDIRYKGLTFTCVEGAYQSQKTSDTELQKKFTELTGPEAKKLGRSIEKDPEFDDKRVDIMKELIDLKFEHQELAEMLKKVEGPIVEDNTWGDTFWGKCDGEGDNNLGMLLAMKRQRLLQEETCDEELLLYGNPESIDDNFQVMLGIYQMKLEEPKCFRPIKSFKEVSADMYELVYTAGLGSVSHVPLQNLLNDIYYTFNMEHPANYYGRSVSVSDIIVIRSGNEVTAFYVQDFGFMNTTPIEGICTYPDWKIISEFVNGEEKLFAVGSDDDGSFHKEVKEVMCVEAAKYPSTGDLLSVCHEDYDYSGELNDGIGYGFWKLV